MGKLHRVFNGFGMSSGPVQNVQFQPSKVSTFPVIIRHTDVVQDFFDVCGGSVFLWNLL